jgi:hypothetical protein
MGGREIIGTDLTMRPVSAIERLNFRRRHRERERQDGRGRDAGPARR